MKRWKSQEVLMKVNGLCCLFILILLLAQIDLQAADRCLARYPTQWNLQNKSAQKLHLQCRTYLPTWTEINARNENFVLNPFQTLSYEFPDHNDGLGMIERNWTCAYGNHPHPLLDQDLPGVSFLGCASSSLVIGGEVNSIEELSISEKPEDKNLLYHCPQVKMLKRNFSCHNCFWDSYSAGDDQEWKGISVPLSPEEISQLQFISVDASADHQQILGCVYYSPQKGEELIMSAAKESGHLAISKYKIGQIHSFKKKIGYLLQCFGKSVEDCPLLKQ